jgi:hypothetical protein
MPKRIRDDEMDAALQAGDPPSSKDHPNDVDWYRAQSAWLQSWRSGVELPKPTDKNRRTEWDKLTKMHERAFAAAVKREEQAREALEAAASWEAVAQAASWAAAVSALELATQKLPAPQAAVKRRAATRQMATAQTAGGEDPAAEVVAGWSRWLRCR